MGRYIIRRLLINIPVLFGITILVFTFLQLAPGDPVSAYLRPELGANEAMREQMRKQLGLDQPAPVRYLRWLGQTLQGNLGYRIVGGQPVNSTIARGLRASGLLMGAALALGCLVGIPLGILSALRQYSKADFVLAALAFLGVSSPSFLLGLGGLYVFGLKLGLFPIGGMFSVTGDVTVLDVLHHLALPALILGFGYNAILMRYTRSSMLEVVRAAYVTTARAKGLRQQAVQEAVELARRALNQTVGQQVQGARIALLGHGVAVDGRPVLAALAHHGIGALAQQPVLDAGEDLLRLMGEQVVRRPVHVVVELRAAALDGEPDLEGEAGIGVHRGLGHFGQVGGHAVAQARVPGAAKTPRARGHRRPEAVAEASPHCQS